MHPEVGAAYTCDVSYEDGGRETICFSRAVAGGKTGVFAPGTCEELAKRWGGVASR